MRWKIDACLSDFQFRTNERFLYEYDFTDQWRHQIRIENILDYDPRKDYPLCIGGKRRLHKGHHIHTYRTLFEKLRLRTTRLYHCDCHSQATKTFSPLVHLLPEHTAPELLYLESKFASRMFYGLSVGLLREVLPIVQAVNATTIRNHVQAVAQRIDAEFGDEQMFFIDGCEWDWEDLPRPKMPLSDGADTVRDLQLYLNPNAEHILDWFHITMRITVMCQMVK